jgi:hypothetical protein
MHAGATHLEAAEGAVAGLEALDRLAGAKVRELDHPRVVHEDVRPLLRPSVHWLRELALLEESARYVQVQEQVQVQGQVHVHVQVELQLQRCASTHTKREGP